MPMFTKNKNDNKNPEAEEEEAAEAGLDEAIAAVADEGESGDDPAARAEAEVAEEPADTADAPTGEAPETDAQADVEEDDEDDEEDDAPDSEDGGEDLDLDLMDIFESEQNESTSTAGIYSEFLESLTMEEVLEQANSLLDEIRAKLAG